MSIENPSGDLQDLDFTKKPIEAEESQFSGIKAEALPHLSLSVSELTEFTGYAKSLDDTDLEELANKITKMRADTSMSALTQPEKIILDERNERRRVEQFGDHFIN